MYGHSAGGLIVPLWLDRLRSRGGIAARNIGGLVLNSPFFDLQGPADPAHRADVGGADRAGAAAQAARSSASRRPAVTAPACTATTPASSTTTWTGSRSAAFPVTFGWINAIRRGQARLHRGLDVGVPNLILRSDHSVPESPDPDAIQRGDAVLDVAQIARWAGCVGNRTTVAPITDAKHDVFLSLRRAARGGLSASWTAGWTATWSSTAKLCQPQHDRDRADTVEHFDLTIIGTGSGNSIPDPTSTPVRTMRVAICEQGTFGGTCLNVGCIPTKMFVYAAEVAETIRRQLAFRCRLRTSTRCAGPTSCRGCSAASTPSPRAASSTGGPAQRRGVTPATPGSARRSPTAGYTLRTEAGDEFTADQVVIAAGSRVRRPAGDPRLRCRRITPATPSCGSRQLPEHLVIVGGGFVAAEFAHVFSALGVRVTIVVRGDGAAHPLRRHDLPPASPTSRRRSGICARTRTSSDPTTTATGSCSNSTTARRSAPTCSWWPPGAFPTATSSTPSWPASRSTRTAWCVVDEYQRTTARGIFALGDVSSAYQLKHVANHEARVVRHNLLLDWDDTAAMTPDRPPLRARRRCSPTRRSRPSGSPRRRPGPPDYDIVVKVQNYGDTAYGWAMEDEHRHRAS